MKEFTASRSIVSSQPFRRHSLALAVRRALSIGGDFAGIGFLAVILLVLSRANAGGLLAALRLLLGLPYVLFVPGYSVQTALFTRRTDLDRPERLALSFGLSIAAIPPIALISDKLPWGLGLGSILVGLTSFTIVTASIAMVRRARLPLEERPGFSAQINFIEWGRQQDRSSWILYGVFVCALVGAGISATAILAAPRPGEKLTEFYLLGPEGLAENYPLEVVAGSPVRATVGIANHEGKESAYMVLVKVGDRVIGSDPSLKLGDGETRETEVEFFVLASGEDQQIEFILERKDRQSPYRTLALWLNVRPAGSP